MRSRQTVDEESVVRAVDGVEDSLGPVDVLINAVGTQVAAEWTRYGIRLNGIAPRL